MQVKATSAGKMIDLRDRASRITLIAQSEYEEAFISRLYRAIVDHHRIMFGKARKKRKG